MFEFDFPVWFTALVGVPVFIAFVVDLLKRFGVITEAELGKQVATWLNIIFFVGLLVTQQFAPEFDVAWLDNLLRLVSELGVAVLALIPVAAKVSSMAHDATRGTVLSKSIS